MLIDAGGLRHLAERCSLLVWVLSLLVPLLGCAASPPGAVVVPETPADADSLTHNYTLLESGSLDPWQRALVNGRQAHEALRRSNLYVHGWLKLADPATGLIPENTRKGRDTWNGRNNAADNYPFMVLTCALTDRGLFNGRMLETLQTEQRLTSRIGPLVDAYSFSRGGWTHDTPDLARSIFDSSEYVKDGLMPLTEWLGPSLWSRRMLALVDGVLERAPFATPTGPIPSDNVEVNGEMMQVLSRLRFMTGRDEYLDMACRIADYYLLGDHHPTRSSHNLRLRDHGCELISGLTEVYAACSFLRKDKAAQYRAPIHEMLDTILRTVNEDGLMFDVVDPIAGTPMTTRLSDSWGYNYNGFYTVYLLDGVERYRDAVRHALGSLWGRYHQVPWEGNSHDGYADSIEGAINLYNREPIGSCARWIDREMRVMLDMQQPDGIIGGWHGDGNYARTAIMWALWKQQSATLQPWRGDARLGGERDGDALLLVLETDGPWSGRVHFDTPRHRTVMHLPLDYPRINQWPQWFTVEPGKQYRVTIQGGGTRKMTGRQLAAGLRVSTPGGVTTIRVEP